MKVLEVGVISFSLYWSILLLLPGETFDNDLYMALEKVAPEHIWGIVIAVIGLTQLFGVTSRGTFFRRTSHLIATGLWSTIATMFIIDFPLSTGGTYYIVSAWCAYLYWKEWRER